MPVSFMSATHDVIQLLKEGLWCYLLEKDDATCFAVTQGSYCVTLCDSRRKEAAMTTSKSRLTDRLLKQRVKHGMRKTFWGTGTSRPGGRGRISRE